MRLRTRASIEGEAFGRQNLLPIEDCSVPEYETYHGKKYGQYAIYVYDTMCRVSRVYNSSSVSIIGVAVGRVARGGAAFGAAPGRRSACPPSLDTTQAARSTHRRRPSISLGAIEACGGLVSSIRHRQFATLRGAYYARPGPQWLRCPRASFWLALWDA